MKQDFISGHPSISTSTVKLKKDDMLRYIRESGHEPVFIDLESE